MGEMLAERDRAAPELGRTLGVDEDAVPDLTGRKCTQREQADRHEDRPRALVGVIAARARRRSLLGMAAVAMLFIGVIVVAVKRVLDVLGGGPARRAEEGHEDQAP